MDQKIVDIWNLGPILGMQLQEQSDFRDLITYDVRQGIHVSEDREPGIFVVPGFINHYHHPLARVLTVYLASDDRYLDGHPTASPIELGAIHRDPISRHALVLPQVELPVGIEALTSVELRGDEPTAVYGGSAHAGQLLVLHAIDTAHTRVERAGN